MLSNIYMNISKKAFFLNLNYYLLVRLQRENMFYLYFFVILLL